MFNVQRRMADAQFAQATTWRALVDAHACWIADYNWQDHWAHQDRDDGWRSPARVLNWVRGRIFAEADVRHLFYTLRFRRKVDRMGFLRFRHWKVYGEAGLTGEAVAVWLYEEELLVVYEDGGFCITPHMHQAYAAAAVNAHNRCAVVGVPRRLLRRAQR